MSKYEALEIEFTEAMARFEESLRQTKTEFMRDSTILRFMLVFDLGWKLVKTWIEEKRAVSCASPVICFREAYTQELISDYDEVWSRIIKMRNNAAHTYNLKLAEQVYGALPEAFAAFQKLAEALKKQK